MIVFAFAFWRCGDIEGFIERFTLWCPSKCMKSDTKIFPRTSVSERPFWFRFLFVWCISTNIRELIISVVYSKSIFDKEHLTEVTVGHTNTCIHTIRPPRLFAVQRGHHTVPT